MNTINRSIALGIVALFTLGQAVVANAEDPYDGVVGTWELDTPSNDWHYVTISKATEGQAGPYVWKNKAGKEWPVSAGIVQAPDNGPRTYTLSFDEKSPYAGHTLKLVRDSDGKLVSLIEYEEDVDILSNNHLQTWVMRR